MNTLHFPPPDRFSQDTTFPYIAHILACDTFSQVANSLQNGVNILLMNPEELAKNCENQMKILQKQYPEDSYYLGEYLHAFRYDTHFRTKKIQEITSQYQKILNGLARQEFSTWQEMEK